MNKIKITNISIDYVRIEYGDHVSIGNCIKRTISKKSGKGIELSIDGDYIRIVMGEFVFEKIDLATLSIIDTPATTLLEFYDILETMLIS